MEKVYEYRIIIVDQSDPEIWDSINREFEKNWDCVEAFKTQEEAEEEMSNAVEYCKNKGWICKLAVHCSFFDIK